VSFKLFVFIIAKELTATIPTERITDILLTC